MTTQLLPAPEPTCRSSAAAHWCCVLVTDHPVISLCGELTCGRRLGGTSDWCPTCLSLAPLHGDECPPCAEWVAVVCASA